MRKNKIAVCDTQGEYACNFAEYLNHRKKLPFEAEAFTDVDKLCAYAGKNPPEILLIAEADAGERIQQLGAESVIFLSEEKECDGEEHKCVYKYQSAESVIQEVMKYYVQNTASVCDSPGKTRVDMIGVYSPVSRCSKTVLALTIGQILGEHKSVLYLNLEDYSGFEQLFQTEYEKNLTDFFYSLRCTEKEIAGELSAYVKPLGKMDHIPPAISPEDIRSIQFAEWMGLFNMLRLGNRYEAVILDIGNGVDQIFKMLSLCRQVYMPVQEDTMSRCMVSQFKKILEQWGGIEERKIRELRLPGYCPEVMNPGFLETLVWGKWGTYVRKVLETDGADHRKG